MYGLWLIPFIQTTNKFTSQLIFQEYATGGYGYRAIVIENRVAALMKRKSVNKSGFITNLSHGGIAQSIIISEQEYQNKR